jgi:hypothetical protein
MTQQAGEAAKSFIDALKEQPLSLALVLMNLCLLGYLYYEGVNAYSERRHELELLYQNRDKMADLLFKCNAPPERGGK